MANEEEPAKRETSWPRVLFQIHVHVAFVYGVYFLLRAKLLTGAFIFLLIATALLGITAGAHRLWAHKSYSARGPLRLFLMLCHTLSGTGTIYDWVLDHRIHHKFYGTNDDPFDHRRGFIYSQLVNRLHVPHPKRQQLLKEIDMSDLESDPIVMFQKRFYWILMPTIGLLLPINAPVEYWGETMLTSIMVTFFRIPFLLHASWLINSATTVWGLQPNDRFFSDSNLVFLLKKTHWPAYHYSAPWDCLTGEFGSYNCGCTTAFIKIWAVMGLAEGLKTIDSRGTTLALKRFADTGKPLADCLWEARELMDLSMQQEDPALALIGTKTQVTPREKISETIETLNGFPIMKGFTTQTQGSIISIIGFTAQIPPHSYYHRHVDSSSSSSS